MCQGRSEEFNLNVPASYLKQMAKSQQKEVMNPRLTGTEETGNKIDTKATIKCQYEHQLPCMRLANSRSQKKLPAG